MIFLIKTRIFLSIYSLIKKFKKKRNKKLKNLKMHLTWFIMMKKTANKKLKSKEFTGETSSKTKKGESQRRMKDKKLKLQLKKLKSQ